MASKQHWDRVYSNSPADGVSWYQARAERSLALIRRTGAARDGRIIDVGGGSSMLADNLLADGWRHLTVLDLSAVALGQVRQRIGTAADGVNWIAGDITRVELPFQAYDIWHDRAVFHFLVDRRDREAYVGQVLRAVKPGGYVIVATFDEHGPLQCSGLPVARYSPDALHAEFGAPFTLLDHAREQHLTPAGVRQSFVYCYCRRSAT